MQEGTGFWVRLGWACVSAGACIWVGCAAPESSVQTVADKQTKTVEPQREPPPEPAEPPPPKRKLVVVAPPMSPDAEAIERSMGQALRRRGFEILPGSDTDRADLVVAVISAAKEDGSWGGIPSQKVLLRYTLFDARRKALKSGQDWASYADAVPQRAVAGALSKVAERLSRRLERVIGTLPPPPPKPDKPLARTDPTKGPQQTSLACLPFRNATQQSQLNGWCETLASIAAQEYKRLSRYRVVERARLREILKDEDITAAIDTSPEAIQRVAKKLGVELLLVGEVAIRPNGDLIISARTVRAKDAEIQHVIYTAAPVQQVDRLEQSYRRQLGKPIAGWITRELDQLRQAPITW